MKLVIFFHRLAKTRFFFKWPITKITIFFYRSNKIHILFFIRVIDENSRFYSWQIDKKLISVAERKKKSLVLMIDWRKSQRSPSLCICKSYIADRHPFLHMHDFYFKFVPISEIIKIKIKIKPEIHIAMEK